VLGLFCEDERDELRRRVGAACMAESIELASVTQFVAISRDGFDNILATFERDKIVLTHFYWALDASVAIFRPRLLILDVLADFFAGDYLNTAHARQFIKVALRGFCVRHGCAVLLLGHPSASGIASGEGDGFSRAWNNTVRSRMFMRKPKSEDTESTQLRRVLEVKKANYGPSDMMLPLIWSDGVYAPDLDPIDEGGNPGRVPRADTKLAVAIMDFMRQESRGGAVVVQFGNLFKHLQDTGALKDAKVPALRKRLGRALAELGKAGLVQPTQVPKGCYRLKETTA